MLKQMRTARNNAKTPTKGRGTTKDPLQVFCRVRPLQDMGDVSCVKVVPPNIVQLSPPESATNYRNAVFKEIQYTFKQVFDESCVQRNIFDHVALGLVDNLLQGRNGLLFTYGVTGSGKTYTMTGEPQDGGIMPRSLDVIFNTIADYQVKKYIFKPDKLNGFDVQSEADAMLDRQNDIQSYVSAMKTPKAKWKKEVDCEQISRSRDPTKLDGLDEDNSYGVFVTYVEIYNNSVYDLLEDVPDDIIRARSLQAKIVREDATRNMYVHGVTEVEVKSTEEAFEMFYKGQRKKRMAHTSLNAESSRSHSVFTIRLVQAPLDFGGENILQDKKAVVISQLSLVDLAGSERTSRTKNSGQRLREAGNINNSLMTLRTCLEILRENQLQGTNKIVPYRDSRLTTLFKNYFDGEGDVRMVVCINPRAEDCDETTQVLKFAELSQEVKVSRPTPLKLDLGFISGRRKVNQVFKQTCQKIDDEATSSSETPRAILQTPSDGICSWSLGPEFPLLQINDVNEADNNLKILEQFLEERITRKKVLAESLIQKEDGLRSRLVVLEKDSLMRTHETQSLKAVAQQEQEKADQLQKRIISLETTNTSLQRKVDSLKENTNSLKRELEEKDYVANQRLYEKEKEKQRYYRKIALTTEKCEREKEQKIKDMKSALELERREQDRKLRQVRRILGEENVTPRTDSSKSTDSVYTNTDGLTVYKSTPVAKKIGSNTAVSNPRHRRSRSVGEDVWLDHRPIAPVPLNTVLQPVMKKRKSVTKLTDVKDVTSKASKYCLMTQGQDSEGDLETKLYKADVVPTSGGGAQVIFNDVETLKQASPTSPQRKRISDCPTQMIDIESKCAVSLEGHSKRTRR